MEAYVRGKEKESTRAKRRILITGASGFLASHLIPHLSGEELILLSRAPERLRYENSIIYKFSPETLRSVFREVLPEYVINTIGILREEKETYETVHCDYVKLLVELSKEFKVKKFIHISALGSSKKSKSRYHKSKALGEKIIEKADLAYLILRPSIIVGKGQLLYADIKRFSKFLPFFVVPKMKIQPVVVDDVVDVIKEGIYTNLVGKFELCGNKVMSMKEFFCFILDCLGIKKPVLELPKPFFLLPALLNIGLNIEQYRMIEDNLCFGDRYVKDYKKIECNYVS